MTKNDPSDRPSVALGKLAREKLSDEKAAKLRQSLEAREARLTERQAELHERIDPNKPAAKARESGGRILDLIDAVFSGFFNPVGKALEFVFEILIKVIGGILEGLLDGF